MPAFQAGFLILGELKREEKVHFLALESVEIKSMEVISMRFYSILVVFIYLKCLEREKTATNLILKYKRYKVV